MGWAVSQLNVDFNTDQVTMGLETTPNPTDTILLGFRAQESVNKTGAARAAQALDDASRRALIAQAKQILSDAASSI